MIASSSYLKDWTPEQCRVLEQAVLIANHRLHETGLFSDEALAELIDGQPDDYLTLAAMGSDEKKFEWMVGERNGASGQDVVEAVRGGKLWVNLVALTRFHETYRRLVDAVYDELEETVPGFRARHRSANLLISSPQAMVYYHVDLPVNMLWHLRGEKRVWVYPCDERFVSQRNLERLSVGAMSEDMPYESWFDDYALSFRVQPGQMITWPQNSPHMVKNLDGLNVSLSTEHRDPVAKRRIMVHKANHFLRNRCGVRNLSSSPHGLVAHLKQNGVRALNLLNRLTRRPVDETFGFRRRFVIDPHAESGYRLCEGETAGDFSEEQSVVLERMQVAPAS